MTVSVTLDAAEAQRQPARLARVELLLDPRQRLGLRLRVPVRVVGLDERAAPAEVELAHDVGAPEVQVDRALVDGRERPRRLDAAEQLAGGDVDDREGVGAGRAQRHARGGVVLGMAQEVGPAPADEVAAGDERLRVRLPARPERLGVVARQRALVRRAQQVREVDALVLVVEDRGLDRPVQELVGVAAEELVERVLARDVDRQPAPAPPGAAPHLAQRRDGARERRARPRRPASRCRCRARARRS